MTFEHSPHSSPKTHTMTLSGTGNSPIPLDRRQRTRSTRTRTTSRDRSMSRSRSPSARRSRAPSRSTVWSNDSMTSFRVSRRSLVTNHLDGSMDNMVLDNRSSKSRHSSVDTDSELHESIGTLIIDEEGATKSDPLEPTSSSSSDTTQQRLLENAVVGGGGRLARIRSASLLLGNSQRRLQPEEEEIVQQDKKPKPWMMRFNMFRLACGNIVNSTPVQIVMSFFILANAIILGALTYDTVRFNAHTTAVLEGIDLGILVAFTIEIAMHFLYLSYRLFSDSWLTFDFVVVVLSWIFLDSPMSVLRSFRIFRVFSLVSRWENLRLLFEAIGQTIPKMASIWVMLLIFFYVFCVLFTTVFHELFDEGYFDVDYFGRLDKTFVTLFQVMTLDNWSEVARATMEYNPWSFLGFFFFILFTSFFVINLVVAVICESLIQISRGQPEQQAASNNPGAQDDDDDDDCDDSGYAAVEREESKERLEDLMRQLLKNQISMAASVAELQRDVKVLKMKEDKNRGGRAQRRGSNDSEPGFS